MLILLSSVIKLGKSPGDLRKSNLISRLTHQPRYFNPCCFPLPSDLVHWPVSPQYPVQAPQIRKAAWDPVRRSLRHCFETTKSDVSLWPLPPSLCPTHQASHLSRRPSSPGVLFQMPSTRSLGQRLPQSQTPYSDLPDL